MRICAWHVVPCNDWMLPKRATPARRVTPCMYNSCILGGGCSVARSATHRLTPTCERLRSAAEVTLSSMASAWRVMPCVTLGLPARWRRALSARGALSSTVALDTGSARNAAHSPAAALLKTTAARHLTPCSHRPLLNCATTWLAVPCINGRRQQGTAYARCRLVAAYTQQETGHTSAFTRVNTPAA